jgi:Flp pilus assembly protein TadD
MIRPLALPALAAVGGLVFAAACSAPGVGSYSPNSRADRDVHRSESLARQSLQYMESDPVRAEALLREALAADLFNGPAHNNLGTILLRQGLLYDAATEFEWARKLLPGHPDPRLNLALTLEHAGRSDDAIAIYTTALEVYPEHIPSLQALTRLQVRLGRKDAQTTEHLQQIALRGDTSEWREWAQSALVHQQGGSVPSDRPARLESKP